MITNWA